MSKFEPQDLVTALSMAIRLRRMEINRSQEGLSYGAGFSRGYLSDVERGVRSISLKNFIRIANSLDIDPSKLWQQAESLLSEGAEINLGSTDKNQVIDCTCEAEIETAQEQPAYAAMVQANLTASG